MCRCVHLRTHEQAQVRKALGRAASPRSFRSPSRSQSSRYQNIGKLLFKFFLLPRAGEIDDSAAVDHIETFLREQWLQDPTDIRFYQDQWGAAV